jgi:hypothetical protein
MNIFINPIKIINIIVKIKNLHENINMIKKSMIILDIKIMIINMKDIGQMILNIKAATNTNMMITTIKMMKVIKIIHNI